MKRLILLLILTGLLTVAASASGTREDGDFSYGDITTLVVEGETFDVEIDAVRGRTVSMSIERYPDNLTVFHSVNGSTVRVWVERRFSLFQRPHNGRMVFTVPAETSVEIDNSTGDIEARGLQAARGGSLSFETSTGDIDLEEITGELSVSATTGNVEIDRVSGAVAVDTTTGHIDVESVEGPVSLRSSTGHQELSDVEGDITLRSTTGRIELDEVSGRLVLRTTTGNVRGRDVRLTRDSEIQSTTGNIELDLVNDINEMEFDLTSTTGSLRVGSDRSQRQLFLGSTGIRLEGSSSTGSQHYF